MKAKYLSNAFVAVFFISLVVGLMVFGANYTVGENENSINTFVIKQERVEKGKTAGPL